MTVDGSNVNFDLVKACINGDPVAWETLRSLLFQLVRRYGARHALPAQDIEDLVQDVCEALAKDDYRLLRSYNPELASLHTFLTSVIVNKKKHWARAHSNHPSVTLPLEEILPDIEDYDSAWARRLELIVLMDIAQQVLSEEDRLILAWYVEGFSFADIASLLERLYGRAFSAAAVRKRKERAIKRIRRALSKGTKEQKAASGKEGTH